MTEVNMNIIDKFIKRQKDLKAARTADLNRKLEIAEMWGELDNYEATGTMPPEERMLEILNRRRVLDNEKSARDKALNRKHFFRMPLWFYALRIGIREKRNMR
jgi:hypothetical protein